MAITVWGVELGCHLGSGIAPVDTDSNAVWIAVAVPGVTQVGIYLLHLSPDVDSGRHHHIQIHAERFQSLFRCLDFNGGGIVCGDIDVVNRHQAVIVPEAHQGEGVRHREGCLILVRDGIGNGDLCSQFRRDTKHLQGCCVHGHFFSACGHAPGGGGGVAPLGAVCIHIADFSRDLGKNALCADADDLSRAHLFHVRVGSDPLCLLRGYVLKCAVGIAAQLPELVGFVAGIQGQDNGK